jgi:hypothetical protein
MHNFRAAFLMRFIFYATCITKRPTSLSSGQIFLLLIMRSRIQFPALPWGFFLEGEDSQGDHGLGSSVVLRLWPLLVLHIYV